MGSLEKVIKGLGCVVVVSLGLGIAQATRADNCSGYDAEFNKSYEQIELSKGNVVSSFINYSVLTSEDDANSNGEMGECHGTWLVTSDGKSSGSGFCAYKDKDGDTEYVQWESTPQSGTWKDVGGTGKWAGKHNSGWTKMVVQDGKMSLFKWGGTCQK